MLKVRHVITSHGAKFYIFLFIQRRFVNCIRYVVSNEIFVMNDKLGRTWGEVVLAYFKIYVSWMG